MYNQTIRELQGALKIRTAQYEEISRKFGEKYIPKKLTSEIETITLAIDSYESKQREIDNSISYGNHLLSEAGLKETPGGKWSVSTDPTIECKVESHGDGELLRFEIWYLKPHGERYLMESLTITPRQTMTKVVTKTTDVLNELLANDCIANDYIVEAEYHCLRDRLIMTLTKEGYEF